MYVRCNIVESVGDKLTVISDALFRAIAPDLISASSFKEARIERTGSRSRFSRNIERFVDIRSWIIYIIKSGYFPCTNIKKFRRMNEIFDENYSFKAIVINVVMDVFRLGGLIRRITRLYSVTSNLFSLKEKRSVISLIRV